MVPNGFPKLSGNPAFISSFLTFPTTTSSTRHLKRVNVCLLSSDPTISHASSPFQTAKKNFFPKSSETCSEKWLIAFGNAFYCFQRQPNGGYAMRLMEMNMNLVNTAQAAKYLGVSKAFLERDRWAGATVPFIKVGSRAVRYRLSDLETFLESRVRHSTSDPGKAHG